MTIFSKIFKYAILKNRNFGKEHSEFIDSDNQSGFEKGPKKGPEIIGLTFSLA